MRKAIKLAVFDIDGTIFRSSLVIELVRGLVQAGIFPTVADREVQKEYLAWVNRRGSYSDYIGKVVKIYTKHIAGKPSKKVYAVARKVSRYQKDRTYRFTRELIGKLKRRKYFLIAISGSPVYIVREYAKAVGFDKWFGTEIEILKSRFTGKVLSLDAAYHKKKVLMEFLKSAPFRVDWKQSAAIGDTESDISVLKMAGRPIAFNPNAQLAKFAKAKGWPIVVERKDVIYRIKDFKFLF